MTLRYISGPSAEPITRAEAKLWLKVDSDITEDDELIDGLVSSARIECEQETNRKLMSQTWERVLDEFPPGAIELGFPALSITGIWYINTAGAETELDPDYYVFDNTRQGFAALAYGYTWPSTHPTVNAVRVRFVAGFGADASSVPAAIKTWIKMRVEDAYKHRGRTVVGMSATSLDSRHYDGFIDPYRVY